MKLTKLLKKIACKLGFHKWRYDYPEYGYHSDRHHRLCQNCLKEQRYEINGANFGMDKIWIDCPRTRPNNLPVSPGIQTREYSMSNYQYPTISEARIEQQLSHYMSALGYDMEYANHQRIIEQRQRQAEYLQSQNLQAQSGMLIPNSPILLRNPATTNPPTRNITKEEWEKLGKISGWIQDPNTKKLIPQETKTNPKPTNPITTLKLED